MLFPTTGNVTAQGSTTPEPPDEIKVTPDTTSPPESSLACYMLTLTSTGNGSVPIADPKKSDGCADNGQYIEGESISLNGATPDEGWQMNGWTGTGDDASTADSTIITMPAKNHTVSVIYSEIPGTVSRLLTGAEVTTYSLDVNKDGTGTGTITSSPAGIDCGTDCTEFYNQDTEVTLIVVTDAASTFTGWTGGGCSGNDTCMVTMDAAKAVTATFTAANVTPIITGQNSLSTPEDTPYTITLADLQVTDPDDSYPGGFTLSVFDGVKYSLDGKTITPAANFNGILTVPVKVYDGEDYSNIFNLSVTVTPVDDTPVLGSIGTKNIDELTKLSFTATATDIDTPAANLTFSITNAPSGATVDPTTGVFTWIPTEAQGSREGPDEASKPYVFDICVSDGNTSNCKTIQVNVYETNIAPVLNHIGNKSVVEFNNLTFVVTATDADLPANVLTYSLYGQPNGATIDAGTGVFTWNPTDDPGPGSYGFDVCVSDGIRTVYEHITITVTVGNKAPVLGAIVNKSIAELDELTFTATATDDKLPSNTLTYSLSGSVPSGATIGASTGAFSWSPTEVQGSGSYPFDVCVSDGALSDCETITITVTETNTAPILGEIGNKSIVEWTPLNFTTTATDADIPENTLTFNLVSGTGEVPDGATIDEQTGVFSWTPTDTQGPDTYTFSVCVSDGLTSDCETIQITVTENNTAPVLGTIGDKSVDELHELTFAVSATDDKLPSNTLIYSLAGSVPTGAVIDDVSGAFSWTPSEEQGSDNYTFNVCVSDGALSDCEMVHVTVNEINVIPVLGAIGDQSVNELGTLTFTATATDADLPENTLSYSVVKGVPSGATIDSNSGIFTWTPTEAQGPGSFKFDVCVSDGILYDCETINVTVNEVNTAPKLGPVSDKAINELATLNFTVSATDPDLPVNTLSYNLSSNAPEGATINSSSGAFSWTPTEEQGPGSYPFDVCVSDGTDSNCKSITVTVTEINIAPILNPIGNKSITEYTELTFIATTIDPDLPLNTLTYYLYNNPPEGASMNVDTGVFTWTPTEDQGPNIYTFDVCVRDGINTTCETIKISVMEDNLAPILGTIGDKSIAELAMLSFKVEANDDGKPDPTLAYSLSNGAHGLVPAGAAIGANDGEFSWIPNEDQGPNTYAFDICVSDGALSDCETIHVNVAEANVAPELAQIGDKSVDELTLINFIAIAKDADKPANSLTFGLADGTTGHIPEGAAINSTSGAFNWTPTEDQGPGSYKFDICVNDGALFDCETITIAVNEVNSAPILGAIGNKNIAELATLTFEATASDDGQPGGNLTFTLANGAGGLVPAGAAIGESTGVFNWTPSETQGPGDYTFDACVSDGMLSDCETIQVNVSEMNVAPVLNEIGNQTIPELTPLTFKATATDVDRPDNTLRYSLADGSSEHVPAGATINNINGDFSWTPTEAQGPKTYAFNVCANDGILSDCEEIQVAVQEVNVAPILGTIGNQSIAELTPLTFKATAIDTDMPSGSMSYSLEDGVGGDVPDGATINSTSGAFKWTPTENQGPDSYTFDVCASDGVLSDCETIHVIVSEVNADPELEAIGNHSVAQLSTLSFTARGKDNDIPANKLTYSLYNNPPTGSSINKDTGDFSWTPTEAQGPGPFTFDVCVNDGLISDCEEITVSVTLLAKYDLNINSLHGAVTKNPNKEKYSTGDVVQLTAAADTGWTFAGWSDGAAGTTNPVSIMIQGNTTITANYNQVEYTLTVTGDHGTVDKNPEQEKYHYGDLVNLTARAAEGFGFSNWSGGATDTANPVSITIHGNTAVTANFISAYTLTIYILGGGGTINLDKDGPYRNGDIVTLTAKGDSNYYRLSAWGDDLKGKTNPAKITMDGNKVVTATFEHSTFYDVPYDHPNYLYIQTLFDAGFTAGCQKEGQPLMFCPEAVMLRAESSVFMLKGKNGAGYTPPAAHWNTFHDDWTAIGWAEKWAQGMWNEGLTAGCQYPANSKNKLFCPYTNFTREEGAVFALRIKYGNSYTPLAASGTVFADATDPGYWSTKWLEKAYADGLLLSCGTQDGKPKICPTEDLSRSWAAYMVVIAKDLAFSE
jgi:uncharacterized repeat protein (TIGR02543 family)